MKAVFVITGVCEGGRTLNLDLARFLAHDDHLQVLWVDFKGPDDFSQAKQTGSEALPNTQICAAPNAVWAAPPSSIPCWQPLPTVPGIFPSGHTSCSARCTMYRSRRRRY